MNVLDLFSGIGGFSLGLERAGMRTVAFCEIDPYCRTVLRRHWPDVPVYDDVRSLAVHQGWLVDDAQPRCEPTQGEVRARRERIAASGIDLICGGFPCQDISTAGKGAGITGARSGLWSEYARIVGEVRPRYVIVENVAALLGRGIERVLGDLAALGFDAEWHCIPASAVGAPHRRDRVWIIAHTDGWGQCERSKRNGDAAQSRQQTSQWNDTGRFHSDVAHTRCQLLEGWFREPAQISTQWLAEPSVGRVAHGVPARVDRLRALGNAVVPQIPEIIGRAIMSAQP